LDMVLVRAYFVIYHDVSGGVFSALRIGFLPLAKLPFLNLLGGDQFRKFCVVSIIILVITVWITCFCHEERETVSARKERWDPLLLSFCTS